MNDYGAVAAIRGGVTLLFVALLLVVALARRGGLTVSGRRLRLVDRLELGDRRSLALVRLDDRELLVGAGPSGVVLLQTAEVDVTLEPVAPTASFSDLLTRATQRLIGGNSRPVAAGEQE